MAFKTLEKSYLLRNEETIELPSDMFMRVSIGMHCYCYQNEKEIFDTYSLLARGFYIHATPTLFNCGTKK